MKVLSDDVIPDPMMGTGTVGVAAKMLGRGFVGIELSAQTAEKARRRFEAEAGVAGLRRVEQRTQIDPS